MLSSLTCHSASITITSSSPRISSPALIIIDQHFSALAQENDFYCLSIFRFNYSSPLGWCRLQSYILILGFGSIKLNEPVDVCAFVYVINSYKFKHLPSIKFRTTRPDVQSMEKINFPNLLRLPFVSCVIKFSYFFSYASRRKLLRDGNLSSCFHHRVGK